MPIATVPATVKLLSLLQDSGFAVLENFHPGFPDSITLVDADSDSAITVQIVESSDATTDAACEPEHRGDDDVCRRPGCWAYKPSSCLHCDAEIRNDDLDDGTWTDQLSGDVGGTYDYCPVNPTKLHEPG